MTSIVKVERESCVLCDLPIESHSVVDGDKKFCCHGCHAVYNILSAKNALDNFKEHPVFEQALYSGLISNPLLLEQVQKEGEVDQSEVKRYYFEVGEMWCPSCAEVIRLILLQKKGVVHCIVDYSTDLASVEYSPRYLSKEEIEQTIENLGYTVHSLQGEEARPISLSLWLRFILAAFCSLNIMMFSYPIYASYFSLDEQGYARLFALLSAVATLPVVTYSLWPIMRRFINSLIVGVIGMEALVLTGVFSALFVSLKELYQGGTHVYFDSLSVIITLVLLGKILESKAKFSSKESIVRLARSSPKKARKIFSDSKEKFVLAKEIIAGDLIKVVSGEKVPLDGVVVSGNGCCDESLMTGESYPRRKTKGDSLLGGTLLQSGSLSLRVTATLEESAMQKILDLVYRDIGKKSVYTRAADQLVQYIVPLVLLVALITGSYVYFTATIELALIRVATILLISCPCAIGIAAPLAESMLMHAIASSGALVRNRAALLLLGKETLFVSDKTGTLTEGKFFITSGLEKLQSEQLSILKKLTFESTHPIAKATNDAILENPENSLTDIQEIAGKGIKGNYNGELYLYGSASFLCSEGVKLDPVDTEKSVAYFCKKGGLTFPVLFGDRLRKGAKEVIQSLFPLKRVLLSGDIEPVVKNVATTCGFDAYQAGVSPLEKREYIEQAKSKGDLVTMVGDGINDAPAITAADIGFSVVSATDISIHVSDILLTTDDLDVIPKIRKLAIKGRKIVAQNLFWAFFYNIVGIALAVGGWLTPLYAAFAMVTSSLIVLFNAKRL